MCPPILTVTVCVSLLPELLFDGEVVVETLLDTLKVRSCRLFTVETDGAIAEDHDLGKKLEEGGLDGDVADGAVGLAVGLLELDPPPTGRRGIDIGGRPPEGLMPLTGESLGGLLDRDGAASPDVFHMETVSVGLVVNTFEELNMLRMVLCLDVASWAVNDIEPDLAFSFTVASLLVTSWPSSCFGIQNWTQASSTSGSSLPETTKLTMVLYWQ